VIRSTRLDRTSPSRCAASRIAAVSMLGAWSWLGACSESGAATRGAAATLPSSLQPAPNDASWAVARRDVVLARARDAAPARVVLVGDSITQGFEAEGADAWARHLAPLGALNLGCTGDRTEHVLWRLQQAPLARLQPAHLVLLLGTNNLGHGTSSVGETVAGVIAVVHELRAACPDAVLHLHEIFRRDAAASALRADVEQVNAALRTFVRQHAAGDAPGRLLLHAFGNAFVGTDGAIPATAMPDGLHLSAAAYERWAQDLAAALRRAGA
jgi:lysophospholipase L1-like esterase